jgi:hypothetical protein
MIPKKPYRILPLLSLIAGLAFSGCAPLTQIVRSSGIAPTMVVSVEKAGPDNPDVYVEPAAFEAALLKALATQDTEKLRMWMTDPFLTGTWRGDLSDTSAAESIKTLYTEQLSGEKMRRADSQLALVNNVDLKALLGGKDPLSIPRGEAGVTDAFLVSGWGLDGRDEAILFLARQVDNSLKWHGWMLVRGGFSGARLGGNLPYKNDALGFSLYLPKNYEFPEPNASEVVFMGPGSGHPTENRVGVFITAEPANGRTAEQIATQLAAQTKAEMGAGYSGGAVTAMSIDGEAAFSVSELPGQDINRQLFMVHDDRLYHMMFVPDSPRAAAYQQMEDAYAMIVNTWHFTR